MSIHPAAPWGTRRRVSLVLGVLVLLLTLTAARASMALEADEVVVLSGTVDDDRVAGPRWSGVVYTPTVSGEEDLVLSWSGSGDLALSVYVLASNSWVGSNKDSDGSPKLLTVDLDAGVAYRLG
ncbi:MAG: hypothetical protein HKN94_16070, partial [Acidimicrobiales bacterium]|nr:hypothetical protein [Acidimicrobiales bacterium]